MEQTIMLKGIALFATLIGIQQWLSHAVAVFDILFIILIVAFLLSLEIDYQKHAKKKGDNPQLAEKPEQTPFLVRRVSFA